jgi:hypothetical protein
MRLNNDARRQLGLMEWLSAEGSGGHDVGPFYAKHAEQFDVLRDDLRQLESLGFLEVYFAGGMVGRGTLTPTGRAYVEDIRRRRGHRMDRRSACRSTLLSWLSQKGADSDASRTSWEGLSEDELNDFYGERFTQDEIDQAAASLKSLGYIDGLTVEETARPVVAWLTDIGLECVDQYDGDLTRLMADRGARHGSGTTVVNFGYAQIATGDGSNQQLEINVAVTEVRNEVAGLVEVLRSFGVEGADELLGLYEELVTSDSGPELRRSGLERFGERLRGVALSVAGDARSAVVSLLVAQVLANVHNLVGSIH